MKEVGILNADIISRSGHRDEIIVCDRHPSHELQNVRILKKSMSLKCLHKR
jgi:hypothetical protein